MTSRTSIQPTHTSATAMDPSSNEDPGEALDQMPVHGEPSYLPGRAKVKFSPLQFFALSRQTRDDVAYADDDALWLTQEECPVVHPDGIEVHGRIYFDPGIQPYIDTRTDAAKPPLVIRYDRALLARGVLDEVRIYHIEAEGSYREVCRCAPRDGRRYEFDLNQVERQHAMFVEVLKAKLTRAEEERFTQQHGEKAAAEFLDMKAARARRQKSEKKEPIPATPITHKNRKQQEQEKEAEHARQLAKHLAQSTPSAKAEEEELRAPIAASPEGPESSVSASGGSLSPSDASTATETLAQRLGGTTGFSSPDDED